MSYKYTLSHFIPSLFHFSTPIRSTMVEVCPSCRRKKFLQESSEPQLSLFLALPSHLWRHTSLSCDAKTSELTGLPPCSRCCLTLRFNSQSLPCVSISGLWFGWFLSPILRNYVDDTSQGLYEPRLPSSFQGSAAMCHCFPAGSDWAPCFPIRCVTVINTRKLIISPKALFRGDFGSMSLEAFGNQIQMAAICVPDSQGKHAS